MSESNFVVPENFQLGEWLRGQGRDADLAICTRVRVARNIQGYGFQPTLKPEDASELLHAVHRALTRSSFPEQLRVVDLTQLDEIERGVLMERHLISRDLAASDRPRSVAVNEQESVSVMVNEEDHVRAQVFHSGFAVNETYARAERLDDALMAEVPFAFSEEFGFLTSCPTNVGTGLRLSVMLHLPGLVWADEIDKATATVQKISLAVRGLYGEGSRALGDFYQVSNQVTLGRSERDIVRDVETAVERLMSWEREVREALLRGDSRARTLDRIHRALGVLERAHILSSEEALNCLSAVRFGVHAEIIDNVQVRDLNIALLLSQPAHLQRVHRMPLSASQRDERRATLVRSVLRQK
ncbi:MAG: protein arginine kinase [Planctomycetota bacterium]